MFPSAHSSRILLGVSPFYWVGREIRAAKDLRAGHIRRMSNQVYDNQQQKYYGQRGLTAWNLAGDQNVAADLATHQVVFANTSLYAQTDPGNFTFDPITLRFTTVSEGQYSIKFICSFTSDDAVTAQNFQFDLRQFNGFAAANLQLIDRLVLRTPALAGGNTIISIGQTVFLPAGSTFDVLCLNALAGSIMTLQSNQTQMLFVKIA
jgi:hypothetical protein